MIVASFWYGFSIITHSYLITAHCPFFPLAVGYCMWRLSQCDYKNCVIWSMELSFDAQ